MLLGNVREDLHPNCRTSRSAPHITPSFLVQDPKTNSLTSSSTSTRNSIQSQQTIMNYARMSYRYTTVTLLSMRPPPDTTIFPDHLVEQRFLDDENYIDLDRMLAEKAGNFRSEPYGMRDGAGDGPLIPTRIHKYDFSDPVVIEKVKNRRPKDALTPHQVAALTSVATRHQTSTFPTPLLSPHPIQSSHIWVDDYNHRPSQSDKTKQRYHISAQTPIVYQRQNSNQFEIHPSQAKPLLPNYQQNTEQNTNSVPILQRLFQAQQRQQYEQRTSDARNQHSSSSLSSPSSYTNSSISTSGHHLKGLSTFCQPAVMEQSNSCNTFAWPFSSEKSQKSVTHPLHIAMSTQNTVKKNQDVLSQLISEQLRCSTTMQTPITPNTTISGSNNSNIDGDEDDDDQNFYSAPPSPTVQHDNVQSLFNDSKNPEHTRIYNQAVLLNSLIRNMVNENNVKNSSSNASCCSNDTQSTKSNKQEDESYAEMYNLIRLLSPGVKNIAQQELLEYLEQGCLKERDEMLRLVASLNSNEQSSLKPILLRLINEQLDTMKKQQQVQQGHPTSMQHRHSQESRSTLESWFGSDIYTNAYPCMPSDRVISAYDLEQSRSTK